MEQGPTQLRSTRGKIQEQAVGIGDCKFADLAAVDVFLCDMSEHAAGQFFWRGAGIGAAEFIEVLLYLFEALHCVTEVVDAFPHAHIRVIARASDRQIDRAVGHAERVFIVEIFPFLEIEQLVVEFGNPLGLGGSNRDMIDLSRLLPAVVFVTFLHLRMLLP